MGFLHEHKLSHENDFHALLKGGRTFTSNPLRFLYTIEKVETKSFQVAISVPKKKFHHAVDRNLMKRRIREGIRHVYNNLEFENSAIRILIVYNDSSIFPQSKIESIIEYGFKKILDNA